MLAAVDGLAKTYIDLMALLPEASEIRIRWERDEDALPGAIDSFTVIGHAGETVGEVEADDFAGAQIGEVVADAPLSERLRVAFLVLAWLDPMVLDERDGESVLTLPSPRHIPETPPAD